MKAKILVLLFLGILNVHSQTTKKPIATTKNPVTTAKPKASVKPVNKLLPKTTAVSEGIFANVTTTKGTIILQLEYKKTPVTVANFISLAEGKNTFVTDSKLKDKPYYNGLKFHRVIKDFMIQGGDPTGTGSGGPDYAFKDEITDLKHSTGGILSMANSGPATNGSQFFITHKETPWLDGKHTVFGRVTQGMDVVNAIAQDDVILKVVIVRKGIAAKAFDAPKVFAKYYNNKAEDAKIQAVIDAENQKKQAIINAENQKKQAVIDAEAKRVFLEKYGSVIRAKKAYFDQQKATATATESGLLYKITEKGSNEKPADSTTINFKYAGYFEDSMPFDSNMAEVAKIYGKYDAARDSQGGYAAFPFETASKGGMIPGFQEGMKLLSYGNKAIIFIPSALAYGVAGAGGVIPPNSNLIFEIEIMEKEAVTTKVESK